MKKLQKDLQAVTKALKGLALKVEKIQKEVERLDKPKTKARPVKKAPVKKVAAKKAVAKKPEQKTAFDTVIGIINRYKKGVNTATLMKKTGFSQKKIANLVYKGKKQGMIKSVGRGVYLKA